MAIFRGDERITFSEAAGHRYVMLDKPEVEPISVTQVLNRYKQPFEEQKISYYVARQRVRGKGWKRGMPDVSEEAILREQIKVLEEWDQKKEDSILHGGYIHDNLEAGFRGQMVQKNMLEVFNAVSFLFNRYAITVPEPIIGMISRNIVGRPDYICYRRRSSNVIDIKDIKTNLSKGIQFDSTLKKDGKIKHYDRFMLEPVSHLEDCNYNHYSLQMSMYAYILEKEYGFRIGSLEIVFIDIDMKDLKQNDIMPIFDVVTYPVAYLRYDAKAIIEDVYQDDYGGF